MEKLKKFFEKQMKKLMLALMIWSGIMMWKATKGTAKLLFQSVVEIKFSKSIALSKEKYIYLACTFLVFFIIAYYINIKYFYIAFFVYFVLRVLFKETVEKTRKKAVSLKIDTLSKRYKKVCEIFGDKIKVVDVKKDVITVFSKEVTHVEIEKQKIKLENFFNRKIAVIRRNKVDFKYIDIVFFSKTKFNRFYYFSQYINFVNIKTIKTMYLPVILGLDEKENIFSKDLADIKHLFISGESGGGKSTMLNCIIQSLLVFCQNVNLILIDLKEGVEMSDYNEFKNCCIVSNIEELKKTLTVINDIMLKRLRTIRSTKNCKNIQAYNAKKDNEKMNYIIMIIDEMAEIKLSGASEKEISEVEKIILQILQKGRVAGIHLIGATQRPAGTQINTDVRGGFLQNISFNIKTPETQRMTKLKGTESLNEGEFKATIEDDSKIYKGFFISDEANKKKGVPKTNEVFEDLEHKLIYNKFFIEIKEKEIKDNKRFYQKMLLKVNKSYPIELATKIDYRQLIKEPYKSVINDISDVKKLAEINDFSEENDIPLYTDNYFSFLNFIFVNSKDNNFLPETKEIENYLNISKDKRQEYNKRAEEEGYIYKFNSTRFKIFPDFTGWNKFRKENNDGQ